MNLTNAALQHFVASPSVDKFGKLIMAIFPQARLYSRSVTPNY
jgi:hypothetical protein